MRTADEGRALLRLIEQRIAVQVAPLHERIAELEAEIRALRNREPHRPGILGRLTGALSGSAR